MCAILLQYTLCRCVSLNYTKYAGVLLCYSTEYASVLACTMQTMQMRVNLSQNRLIIRAILLQTLLRFVTTLQYTFVKDFLLILFVYLLFNDDSFFI
jgi:glycerol-3-phosphate acyltransferase PlsY